MSLHEKMTNYESQLRYYGVFKRPAELKLLLEEIPKSRGQHVKITVSHNSQKHYLNFW